MIHIGKSLKLCIVIGLLFLFFPQKSYAQEPYRELLEFDSEGNLIMTTHDKIATGTITYKTIGWTIKRYNVGVYDPRNQCAFIPVSTLEASRVDPENPSYKYSYFYCDKDTIYNAIGNVSKEWQTSLYVNGGDVWLDAIMTVCDNGVPRGQLIDSAPTCIGDVYFTYDGICGAANWRDPSTLVSHYDKMLPFPANPSFLAPKEVPYTISHYEEYGTDILNLSRYQKDTSGTFTDSLAVTIPDFSANYYQFHYGVVEYTTVDGIVTASTFSAHSPPVIQNASHNLTKIVVILYYYRFDHSDSYTLDWNYDSKNNIPLISSLGTILPNEANPDYNPSTAIPSGSYLDIRTTLDSYAFTLDYQKHYGQITLSLPVQVTYDLVWSDSVGNHQKTVTFIETYYVDRSYEFYLLNFWNIYLLDTVNVSQYAFDTTRKLSNPNTPAVTVRNNPDWNAHWSTPERPPYLDVYGGVLNGNGQMPALPEHTMQSLVESTIGQLTVTNDHFQIDDAVCMNSDPYSTQTASPVPPDNYAPVTLTQTGVKIPETRQNYQNNTTLFTGIYQCYGKDSTYTHTYSGTSVSIHTPVLCTSQVSDDRKKNQLLTPNSSRASLILGQTFSIRGSFAGTHIDTAGYGERDYSTFVKDFQIRLPFEAYLNGIWLEPNVWYTISSQETLYLPTGVPEGDYEIETRVLATNCILNQDPLLDPGTFSEDFSAKLSEEKSNLSPEHTIATCSVPVQVIGRLYGFSFSVKNHNYTVGIRNENGILRDSPYTFPLRSGGLFNTKLPFTLTTIGNALDSENGIKITPTFYYVDSYGKNRQPVNLYYLKNDQTLEKYTPVISLDSTHGTFAGSKDMNVKDQSLALSSVQHWSGTFSLPKPFLVVPKSTDLSSLLDEKGSLSPKDSVFLQDGFLIVNFDISTVKNKRARLNYLNTVNSSKGYCNMWKTEGFSYSRKIDGHTFSFTNGDALLFSLDSQHWKVYGTH